jgi:hypothetical protein
VLAPLEIFGAIQPYLGHVQPQRLCSFICCVLRPSKAIGGTPAEFLGGHAGSPRGSVDYLNAALVKQIKKSTPISRIVSGLVKPIG